MDSFYIFGVPAVLGIYWLTLYLDKNRITEYLSERGNAVQSIRWRLFGRGWMGESSPWGAGNQIYEVEYKDSEGNLHRVWAKTAVWSGVYLSEDTVISTASRSRGNSSRPRH